MHCGSHCIHQTAGSISLNSSQQRITPFFRCQPGRSSISPSQQVYLHSRPHHATPPMPVAHRTPAPPQLPFVQSALLSSTSSHVTCLMPIIQRATSSMMLLFCRTIVCTDDRDFLSSVVKRREGKKEKVPGLDLVVCNCRRARSDVRLQEKSSISHR